MKTNLGAFVRTADQSAIVSSPNRDAVRRHAGLAAEFLCPLLLIAAAVATFFTAARDEDFLWADGASFALNGELIRDYLASGLHQTPWRSRWNGFAIIPP